MTTREPERLLRTASGLPSGDADQAALTALLRRAPASVPDDRLADERVYRRILRKQAAPSPFTQLRAPAFAAAVGLAVLCLVLFGTRQSSSAVVRQASGAVLALGDSRPAFAPKLGAPLPAGARLHTEARGAARVTLARAEVAIGAETDVEFSAIGRATLLTLRAGEVVSTVDPRRSGETFAVRTSRYLVTVKGTIFSVRQRSEDDVEVEVTRGRVQVDGNGGRWEVGAGQSWRSLDQDRATAPAAPNARPEETIKEDRALPAGSARAEPGPAVARLVATERPPPERSWQSSSSLALNPPPPPAPKTRTHPDLDLYELGRERTRSGDVAGALAAFQSYARVYPQGALAQEAALSTIELLLQQDEMDPALSEIDRFVARFPENPRVPELRLRSGDALRAQGKPEKALSEYLAASSTGADSVAEEASYQAAMCAEGTGQRQKAETLLQTYLVRFPHGDHAEAIAEHLRTHF